MLCTFYNVASSERERVYCNFNGQLDTLSLACVCIWTVYQSIKAAEKSGERDVYTYSTDYLIPKQQQYQQSLYNIFRLSLFSLLFIPYVLDTRRDISSTTG